MKGIHQKKSSYSIYNVTSSPFDKMENNLYNILQNLFVSLKSNNISNYTFAKVGTNYSGPIVGGWPPTKSRNVRNYISEQTVIRGLKNKCSENATGYHLPEIDGNLNLLIMQHSSPTNFAARQSNRETWMKLIKVLIGLEIH